MLTLFALLTALAADAELATTGQFRVDAELATEVRIDGQPAVKLFFPGTVSMEVATGEHKVTVLTNGNPSELMVEVKDDEIARVLVGRTGISADQIAVDNEAAGETRVELRATNEDAQVRIGSQRYTLGAGKRVNLVLQPGEHRMSIRNSNGTVIWASGTLQVAGGEDIVVQVSEGRMPSVSDGRTIFVPGT